MGPRAGLEFLIPRESLFMNGIVPHLPGQTRRSFLVASTAGLAGAAFARGLNAEQSAPQTATSGKARSTILFFLCGGASHLDTWDMKLKAPREYRGPFEPIATSAPGVTLSEHLPLLSQASTSLGSLKLSGSYRQYERSSRGVLLQSHWPRPRSKFSNTRQQPDSVS